MLDRLEQSSRQGIYLDVLGVCWRNNDYIAVFDMLDQLISEVGLEMCDTRRSRFQFGMAHGRDVDNGENE